MADTDPNETDKPPTSDAADVTGADICAQFVRRFVALVGETDDQWTADQVRELIATYRAIRVLGEILEKTWGELVMPGAPKGALDAVFQLQGMRMLRPHSALVNEACDRFDELRFN